MNTVYDPDADERPAHQALPDDEEMRRLTGIGKDEEKAIDRSALEAAEKNGGLFNPHGDSGAAAGGEGGAADKLRQAENQPAGGGSLFNAGKDAAPSRRQRVKNRLRRLGKNKLFVGVALGGGGGFAIVIILLILAVGSLKIPDLAQNIATYQFVRLTRQLSDSVTRSSDESLAIAATDDTVYGSLKAKVTNAKGKAADTFAKLDKYRPAKVMQNLQTDNGLKFSYKLSPLGRQQLAGVTLDNATYLPVKQGLTRFVPGLSNVLQFKNNVTFSKNFVPALDTALRTSDVGPIVRGSVAKQIRQELGISLVAWTLGKYAGKDDAQARLQETRERAQAIDENTPPDNAVTDSIKNAEEGAKEAVSQTEADDAALQQTIDNGGVVASAKKAVSDALAKSGLQEAVSFVNPIYGVAVPVCIVYDGSLDHSGPTIDGQMRQQQAAFYYIESAASQQKNGTQYDPTGKSGDELSRAVGALNTDLGDTSQTNAEIRAAGGTIDTSGSLSAEASAGGEFTLLNATPGIPSGVADTINAVADQACPVLTNIWGAVALGGGNIVLSIFSGGTADAAEEGAGQAAKVVIEDEATSLLARLVTRAGAVGGRVKSLLYDTGKSAAKIAAATVVAKYIVDSRASQFNSGLSQGNDLANMADAGGNLHANEIERQGMYGRPLTEQEEVESNQADRAYLASQAASESSYERYLATSNAHSLVSRLAVQLNGHLNTSILTSILKLASFLLKPLNYIGSLFPLSSAAEAATTNSNYGNVQFGFSKAEEDLISSDTSYLPLENQEILDQTQIDGKSAWDYLESSQYVKCFTNTMGDLLSNGNIQRDPDGNVLQNAGDCSPASLGPGNMNGLVFRWRLAHAYNMALDQLGGEQDVAQ